jgi:hypothetical protein
MEIPIVDAEWVGLPLRIWEVPSLNLGPDTGYPDRDFLSSWRQIQMVINILETYLRQMISGANVEETDS